MITLRIHYFVKRPGEARFGQPRCGHPGYQNWTTSPSKVTCENCKRLMAGEVK